MRIQIILPLISLLVCLGHLPQAYAATILSTQTGNFNSGSTWEGGIVPGASDSAVVLSSHTVTVTASDTVKSVCVYNADDATTSVLIINSGTTLTITAYLRVQSDDAVDAPVSRVDIKGTLIIGKDIYLTTSEDGAIAHTVINMNIASTTPILQIDGTIINEGVGGSMNANSTVTATVKMTGSVNKTLLVSGTAIRYHHITIDKSGGATVTLGGALTSTIFRGNFTLENGKFDNGGYAIAGLSGKSFTVKNGTTFLISNSSGLPTTVTNDFQSGSTVQFQGTNNINASQAYHNLAISGSGTKTLTGNITVNGNLTASAGTLDVSSGNNYSITIKGNWINSGCTFQARSGTVTFSGTSNQQITSNGNGFYNLVIDNSATQVSLNDNLTVSNLLTLTDGVITTGSSYRVIISSTSSTSMGGYSSASFVNGNLRRNIASNTDTYAFPIGNGTATTNYYRADLENNNLTGITYIDARFKPLTGHLDSEMDVMDNFEHGSLVYSSVHTAGVWELEPDASPTGGMYDVKFYIANMSGFSDNDFGPLKRPVGSTSGADWTNGGGQLNHNDSDGRTVASGFMERRLLTSFSEFGGGSGSSSGGGLPVELLRFNAKAVNGTVEVSWATATETNNELFTVERSSDGRNFISITTVRGAGSSMQMNEYSIVDYSPLKGISYYRLRQTDFDRTSVVASDIVSVSVPYEPPVFSVLGHPSDDRSIRIVSSNSELQTATGLVSVFDVGGRKILRQPFQAGGSPALLISLPASLQNGIYFVRIECLGKVSIHKVLL